MTYRKFLMVCAGMLWLIGLLLLIRGVAKLVNHVG